jgi:hypothetical protein
VRTSAASFTSCPTLAQIGEQRVRAILDVGCRLQVSPREGEAAAAQRGRTAGFGQLLDQYDRCALLRRGKGGCPSGSSPADHNYVGHAGFSP